MTVADADGSRAQPTMRSRTATLAAVTSIALIVVATYGHVLFAPFFFDDTNMILLNPTLTSSSASIMFSGTRPLINASFALTYRVSGRSPWAHRLGNLLLHAANALFIYLWMRCGVTAVAQRHWVAWVASVFFAVHPLQTEAVTYISGRPDVQMTFFALLAMLALTGAWHWRAQRIVSTLLAALVVLATIAATASKETGVALPVILLAYDAVLGGGLYAALRRHAAMYVCLIIPWILALALLARNPGLAQTAGFAFGRGQYGIAPLDYFFTQMGVILHYLRLTLLPYGQAFDYDWPIVTNASGAALPALVLVLAVVLGLWAGRRSAWYALAVLWIMATLAPTSSVVPIADVVAERRMYTPLVGMALLVALGLAELADLLERKRIGRRWLAAGCALVLTGFAMLSWRRNELWNDPLALWQDTVAKQPGNPRARTNLGIRYLQRGNVEAARIELETALDLVGAGESSLAIPRHGAFAATHLALAYLELGDPVAAQSAYDVARELGAESYRELHEPLQRAARTLATATKPDPDAQ